VVEVSIDISLIERDYELDWIIKQIKGKLEGSPHKGGFSLVISEKERVPVRTVYKYLPK
jgi:ArsR family metal-binding transcriptional regulator